MVRRVALRARDARRKGCNNGQGPHQGNRTLVEVDIAVRFATFVAFAGIRAGLPGGCHDNHFIASHNSGSACACRPQGRQAILPLLID